MEQSIHLTIKGDKIKVISPYNEEFVNKARNFRGKFKDGAWWFDDSLLDYVREVMISIYGTTGEILYDTCTLLIKDFSFWQGKGPVVLFGRTIAKAWGRDSDARLGDDIVFISGIYKSGGSVKNWETIVQDATFEIKNFPVPSIELKEVKDAISAGWCIVKMNKKRRDPESILAEIDELNNRIADLQKEYNSYDI